VGIGAIHVVGGTLGIPELLIVLLLVGQCFTPVLTLKRIFHYAYFVPTIAASMFELLDATAPVMDKAAIRPQTADIRPPLVFEQVTFHYPTTSRLALKDVSFTLMPGQNLALVGRSGAGKTTVTSLMLRFFDPQKGRITIGGVNLRDLPLADLRRLISVVSQDVYLFHGTIRENLLFARPDAKERDLVTAARMAAAHEFIMATPDGYNTVVGERGLKLSGGERQRIAIARALLKDAPILILDEATSSVDIANETAIQKALRNITYGRSVLTIAHRLSTVKQADAILVLDSGRLLENGTHQSLLELNGVYASLAATQEERS
jgi:ABC-type multidrug transport system fused ATPase/permease subunit